MENVGRLGVDPEGSGDGLMFPSIERLSVRLCVFISFHIFFPF
jgi:hypothetical protein